MKKSFLLTALMFAASLSAQERAAWMPEEATATDQVADGGERIVLPVTFTNLPKATADMSKFTKVWTIDLEKFKIKNDASVTVSDELNAALQYAKEQGYNRIIFPKGKYLIAVDKPVILDHKNTIIDLNGSELIMEPNGKQSYLIVEIINGAENLRLTNGTLRGDRYQHDFTTVKGSHEWCEGLLLRSGKQIEIDHLTITECTGSALGAHSMGTRNRPELLSRIFMSIFPKKHLEQGAFDAKGNKIVSTEKTRTINMINLAKFEDQFEIGYLAGYQGFPFVLGRVYQIYFYDKDKNFIGMQKCLQYRKIKRPENAAFMHLEFNQPEVTDQPAHYGANAGSWVLRINNFLPPTDVHVHDCKLINNRNLGFGLCGGQRWIVENNEVIGNGGCAPGYGMDLEDGWELTQDMVFRNNLFKGNISGGIVICAGSELLFENNRFEADGGRPNRIVFYGRTYNYIFRNNYVKDGIVSFGSRTGIATFEGNTYENCKKITVFYDNKGVADGIYRKEKGQAVRTLPLTLKKEKFINVQELGGTYICLEDCELKNVNAVVGPSTGLVSVKDSKIENSTLTKDCEKMPTVIMDGNTGSFTEKTAPPKKGKGKKKK